MLYLLIGLFSIGVGGYFFYEHQRPFKIHRQTERRLRKGFKDCDIHQNGEALLMKYCLKEGAIVFDVGANRGDWSLCALQMQPSIRLWAFEPLPSIHSQLQKNLDAYANATVFSFAMDQTEASLSFFYYPNSSEFSGFYDREILKKDLIPQKLTVPTTSLDRFCEKEQIAYIDFLKIDTEGAEWRVLQGARHLIQDQKIEMIQFEYGGTYIDAKITLEQIAHFLSDNQYLLFRIVPDGLLHIEKWQSGMENYRYSNFLAVKQTKWPKLKPTSFPK